MATRVYKVEKKENIKKNTSKRTYRVYMCVMEINAGNNVGEGVIIAFGN